MQEESTINRLAAIAFLEVLSLVVPRVRGKEVTTSPNSTGQCPPPGRGGLLSWLYRGAGGAIRRVVEPISEHCAPQIALMVHIKNKLTTEQQVRLRQLAANLQATQEGGGAVLVVDSCASGQGSDGCDRAPWEARSGSVFHPGVEQKFYPVISPLGAFDLLMAACPSAVFPPATQAAGWGA
jgi:hypothetical protein